MVRTRLLSQAQEVAQLVKVVEERVALFRFGSGQDPCLFSPSFYAKYTVSTDLFAGRWGNLFQDYLGELPKGTCFSYVNNVYAQTLRHVIEDCGLLLIHQDLFQNSRYTLSV